MKLLEIVHMMVESMISKFFDKKTGAGVSINKQMAEEVHKSVTKN